MFQAHLVCFLSKPGIIISLRSTTSFLVGNEQNVSFRSTFCYWVDHCGYFYYLLIYCKKQYFPSSPFFGSLEVAPSAYSCGWVDLLVCLDYFFLCFSFCVVSIATPSSSLVFLSAVPNLLFIPSSVFFISHMCFSEVQFRSL